MTFFLHYAFYGFISVTLLFVILCLIYCKRANEYWQRKNVYAWKPTLVFGNAMDIMLQKKPLGVQIKEYYDDLKAQRKSFGGYYFLTQPVLVVSDLDLIKRVMVTDFEHFTDRPLHIDEEENPLTGYLPALKGERWKALRMKLSPAFTLLKSKMMLETLPETYADTLMELIDRETRIHGVINVHEIIGKLNMDIIASCAFGFECNSLKEGNAELKNHLLNFFHDQSLRGSIIHILSYVIPNIFKIIKLKTCNAKMMDYFTKLVTEIIAIREKDEIVRNDFMHILLQIDEVSKPDMASESTDGLSLKELVAQCFVFLLGGLEAPSTDKAREEIRSVLKKYKGKISHDALSEMTFIDQCIYETFRMYPPVMIHGRACTKEYVVPGSRVVIEKGTTVFIPTYGLHMDPDYFPNPEVFDPERYSNKISDAWMPMGCGPRICIAYRFGLLQVKYALVTLLRHYKFALHSSTKTPMTFDCKNFLLYPSSPILVIPEKLSSNDSYNHQQNFDCDL
ncbi:probable cytochrome P450 6a23 isoform X2 [Photinus pyralis]|uniref:probable cytochrome P450 6a23 isoform X2 n=1 Tax=Photinus pyralis TaxID=7054 RepID=UPI0012670A1A|nr:probable cytochrome P450 6a23 isoform X2 [Photinus pyralis]